MTCATSPPAAVDATAAEQSLHNNFVVAARQLRRGTARTLYYLLAINEAKVYRTYGFRTLEAYAQRHGGLATRTVREMLTLARRMRRHSQLAEAVDHGRLPWRKALLVSREVVEDGHADLIDLAGELTRRELKQILSASPFPAPVTRGMSGTGDRGRRTVPEGSRAPGGDSAPAEGPAGRPPDDSGNRRPSNPAGQARAVAAGPEQLEADSDMPNSPAANQATEIDAEASRLSAGRRGRVLSSRDPEASPLYVTLKFTPEQFARWEAVIAGSGDPIEKILDALAGKDRGQPPFHLVVLHCPDCEKSELVTGRGDLPAPRSLLARARCDAVVENGTLDRRRSIAPRIRRQVMRRARYRCEADGCHHTRWLEVHHRLPASQGGRDDPANLVVLCSACHRRLHEREEALQRTARGAPY